MMQDPFWRKMIWGPDPNDPSPNNQSFYVCSRPTELGNSTDKCACHVDIYGSFSGEIYVGWRGGIADPKNSGLPTDPKWNCRRLKNKLTDPIRAGMVIIQKPSTFQWGPNAGQSCKGATPASKLACIQAKKAPKSPGAVDPPNAGPINNCQTDVFDAIEGCCLTGFIPLALTPGPPARRGFMPSLD